MTDAEILELCRCLEATTTGVVCDPGRAVSPLYREANHEPSIAVPNGVEAVAVAEPNAGWLVLPALVILAVAGWLNRR